MREYKKSYPKSTSLWFTSSHFGSRCFTGVLWLTAAISGNFSIVFSIRDFPRKRTSKEQYPSRIVFFNFRQWLFMKGVIGGNKYAAMISTIIAARYTLIQFNIKTILHKLASDEFLYKHLQIPEVIARQVH